MGFFNFKKKKSNPTLNLTETVNAPSYNPWEQHILPRNENYAIAAMLSCYEHGRVVAKSSDDFPRYLNNRYKIHDPIKYQMKLIAEGYLIEGSPAIVLRQYKLAELKNISLKFGLSEKGKKDELIQRLCENVNANALGLEKVYVPSEKGVAHLKKYEYVFTLADYDISPDQFDEFAKTCHKASKPNDVIWQLLNARYNAHFLANDFGLARNEIFNKAHLLISEKKYTDGLFHFILALYYDTSGMGNNGSVSSVDGITIAPGLVDLIYKHKEHFTDEMISKCYKGHKLPHHYLKEKNFRKLLVDIFDDAPIDIRKYL